MYIQTVWAVSLTADKLSLPILIQNPQFSRNNNYLDLEYPKNITISYLFPVPAGQ